MVIYGRQNATRYPGNGGLFDRLMRLIAASRLASVQTDCARYWYAATSTDQRTLHWHLEELVVSPLE